MREVIQKTISEKSRQITNEIIQGLISYINEDSTMELIKRKIFHPTVMYTANYLYIVVMLMMLGIWLNTIILYCIFMNTYGTC